MSLRTSWSHTMIGEGTSEWLDVPIKGVHVLCGPPFQRLAHDDFVNHWRLFCYFSSTKSICLDMVKRGPTDPTGVLGVHVKEYAFSRSNVKVVTVNFTAETTTRQLLSILEDLGLLRYRYTNSGVGCRFWVQGVVAALERARVLVEGSAAEVDESIAKFWMRSEGNAAISAQMEIQKGEFY